MLQSTVVWQGLGRILVWPGGQPAQQQDLPVSRRTQLQLAAAAPYNLQTPLTVGTMPQDCSKLAVGTIAGPS